MVQISCENVDLGEGKLATLPAGRYGTLIYTGLYSGLIDANRQLLDWGAQQGLAWAKWDAPAGDGFVARFEMYFTDPAEEPDESKHETLVAIKLAD